MIKKIGVREGDTVEPLNLNSKPERCRETQESPAKQAKVAKERRETVLCEASRNGGQNQNPGDPFLFAPFGFFAGQLPLPSAWFPLRLKLQISQISPADVGWLAFSLGKFCF